MVSGDDARGAQGAQRGLVTALVLPCCIVAVGLYESILGEREPRACVVTKVS